MASWKKTISSPFRKARTFFNQSPSRDKKPRQGLSVFTPSRSPSHLNPYALEMRKDSAFGDVMACAYEDVQVMWSILDKLSLSP
ncbi:hypothetical protein EUGRSUZ_H01515 [Eucalyptus grandis]|uniref:Uncharacterized protein n=2 Tax=Eucalyptus grandis TaxID=71139 RepID=A0ACC3JNC7_EUCGR|nr:hypothetical protein EUGRSUZ_H01515 [Eucalyptus grandis]